MFPVFTIDQLVVFHQEKKHIQMLDQSLHMQPEDFYKVHLNRPLRSLGRKSACHVAKV